MSDALKPAKNLFLVERASWKYEEEMNLEGLEKAQKVSIDVDDDHHHFDIYPFWDAYAMWFNSLDELMDFIKLIDEECIVFVDSLGFNRIEIYDHYR